MGDGITQTFHVAGDFRGAMFPVFAILVALLVASAWRAAIGPRQAGKAPIRPAFADVWQALVRLCNHISGTAVVSIFLLMCSMPFMFAFADQYRREGLSTTLPPQFGLAFLCDIVFCVVVAAFVWRRIYRRWSGWFP
jgi:hypothetical protein